MNEANSTLPPESAAESAGKLILRCTVAALMLFHGVAKLQNGIGSIEDMLTDQGLPTMLAYGVYVGEVVAPLLMLVGWLTRISAAVFAFNMVVAIALGHPGEIFALGQFGGWAIELQMLYLLGAVSVVCLGPGRFALGKTRGLWA